MVLIDNKKNIRSFGRINGRGKIDESLISKDYLIDENYKLNNSDINHFEIGFGYGESIFNRALINTNINYIGCETYIKGVLNLCNLIKSKNLDNIKIFNGDARLLIENINKESIDCFFILFPDPWPKKKQNKRRIINEDFIELLSKKLKRNGKVFFASDINNYIDWFIERFNKNKSFLRVEKDIYKEPEWWVKTRYQEKAIKEGRVSKFLEYIKII